MLRRLLPVSCYAFCLPRGSLLPASSRAMIVLLLSSLCQPKWSLQPSAQTTKEHKLCQDSFSFCEALNKSPIPDLHFRFLLCGDEDISAHLAPSYIFSPAHPRPQGLDFALPSLKGKRVQASKKVHRLFNGVMATSLSRPHLVMTATSKALMSGEWAGTGRAEAMQ